LSYESSTRPHTIDLNRPNDIFEPLLTGVLKDNVKFALDVLQYSPRDANAARLSNPFEARRYIDSLTEDVAPVEHDISDIDADAELNPSFLRLAGIAFRHAPLDLDSTAHRIHYTTELSQQPIPGVLNHPPAVFSYLRIDKGAQVILELGVCPFLIQAGQAAVASHVCRQDGRETALNTLDRHLRPSAA
jgi:hypothetical protein